MTSQAHEIYYDNPTQHSPGPHRQSQQHHPVQRQPSRPFDAYGVMPPPPSLYSTEDHAVQNLYNRYPDNRLNATLGSGYPAYDTWSSPSFGSGQNNTLATIGATTRRNPLNNRHQPPRAGLPSNWVDAPPPGSGLPSFGDLPPHLDNHMLRNDVNPIDENTGEDLIPTAIVIKNIPFAVKKEFLVGLMTEMGLPLPYAFNYHFDQGVFRGLAFANFTTADETAMVINRLNHYELQGRKLRVEYKKMLPLAERERIEREKRIKRGQLEEQHRPLPNTQLQTQTSLSSLTSQLPANSPSPVSARPRLPGLAGRNGLDLPTALPTDLDFNDPSVLNIYSTLLVFKNGKDDEMSFSPQLAPAQRRLVHTLAHHLRLAHASKGEGDQRAVHIFRFPEQAQISPSNLPTGHPVDTHRRALNRAATTDFTDVRSEGAQYPSVTRQTSGLFAGFPDSPALGASHNLRAAKSYADLRSYTPSPAQSTASFPANLGNNLSRFAEYGAGTTAASNPNLTMTTSQQGREDLLINGMASMGLGGGFGPGGSPRSTRNAWETRDLGTIGSNRGFNSTQSLDEQPQPRSGQLPHPARTLRGPAPERAPVYPRRGDARQNGHVNGRSSDELTSPQGDHHGEQ